MGAVTAITMITQTNWLESRPGRKNVATIATAMPKAPTQLPLRALRRVGEEARARG